MREPKIIYPSAGRASHNKISRILTRLGKAIDDEKLTEHEVYLLHKAGISAAIQALGWPNSQVISEMIGIAGTIEAYRKGTAIHPVETKIRINPNGTND